MGLWDHVLRTLAALLLSGQPAAGAVWAEGRMGLDLCLGEMPVPNMLLQQWLLPLLAGP